MQSMIGKRRSFGPRHAVEGLFAIIPTAVRIHFARGLAGANCPTSTSGGPD